MVSLNSARVFHDQLVDWVDESLKRQDVDYTNCDREPIHIPNLIQPHGILVVFQSESLNILQVSRNIESYIDNNAESLCQRSLRDLLSNEDVETIRRAQALSLSTPSQPLQITLGQGKACQRCIALLHQRETFSILELEPIETELDLGFFDFFASLKAPIEQLQRTSTLDQLCQVAVLEIRRITGFQRVMIYRFLPDGSGSVIAESLEGDVPSYLGLHYPATDIPKQAKALYTLNWLRMIPTIDYEPTPMEPELNSAIGVLDMSEVGLRSVSPVHIEYLRNMGVQASMSISLMNEGKLWGLVACHHDQPRRIHYPTRICCEFLGQIMSSELAAKERQQRLASCLRRKSMLTGIGQAISAAEQLADGLTHASTLLLELVNASGAVYMEQDNLVFMGETPNTTAIQQILANLDPFLKEESVYSTHQLSQIFPSAKDFKLSASGVLGLCISRTQKIYLLWFRPELTQQIHWAGNPNKPLEVDENGQPFLSPRQSFERWVETVHLQSAPWSESDIESALELRSAIIGLVLQQADELAKVNLELTRSNDDLSSFAYVASHDLKAPLRAIANLACWLQEDLEGQIPEENQAQLDLLQSRVYRMNDMISGLLQYSRVGNKEYLPALISLPELLKEVVDLLSPPSTIEIRLPQETLAVYTHKPLLKQVFTNLISNAIKYINREDGLIEISLSQSEQYLQFAVKDNGPGIDPEYHDKIFQMFQTLQSRDEIESTGIGLAIVKKVVQNQGGKVWVSSSLGKGSTFWFTWPHLSED